MEAKSMRRARRRVQISPQPPPERPWPTDCQRINRGIFEGGESNGFQLASSWENEEDEDDDEEEEEEEEEEESPRNRFTAGCREVQILRPALSGSSLEEDILTCVSEGQGGGEETGVAVEREKGEEGGDGDAIVEGSCEKGATPISSFCGTAGSSSRRKAALSACNSHCVSNVSAVPTARASALNCLIIRGRPSGGVPTSLPPAALAIIFFLFGR